VRRDRRVAVVGKTIGVSVLYDVVLLAGTPRRLTMRLAPDITAESVIEVDGEQWTVADVRPIAHGPSQLICIYGD